MKSFRCLLILCLFLSVSPFEAIYGIGGKVKSSSGGLLRCLVVSCVLYAVSSSESLDGIDQVKEGDSDFMREGVEALSEVTSVVESHTLYSGCDFPGALLDCEKWRKEVEEMFLWEERYDEISGLPVAMSAIESKVADKVLRVNAYDDLDVQNMTLLSKAPRRLQVAKEAEEDYKEVQKRALAKFERAMIPIGIVSGLLVCTSALFIFLGVREDCEKCTKRCACYRSSRCCRGFVRGCCEDPFTCCCSSEVGEIVTIQRKEKYVLSKEVTVMI